VCDCAINIVRDVCITLYKPSPDEYSFAGKSFCGAKTFAGECRATNKNRFDKLFRNPGRNLPKSRSVLYLADRIYCLIIRCLPFVVLTIYANVVRWRGEYMFFSFFVSYFFIV